MNGEPPKAKADPNTTVETTATVKPAAEVDPKTTIDATATMKPPATPEPKAKADNPAPGTKPGKHRGLLIALGVVVVGLVVFSAMALFGDDDPSPSPSSSASTAVPRTTVRPQSTTVAPSPVTTAAASSTPAASTPDSPGTPGTPAANNSGLPGYDSEECAMFRDLLSMVDDPALRAGASQVGCI